jgi:hypothetical protein
LASNNQASAVCSNVRDLSERLKALRAP